MNYNPKLVMVIEPEAKYRFRYESEKGSHGGLTGKEKLKGKKTYPTVKLLNCIDKRNVFVRVSLYTEKQTEHVLEFKTKKSTKGQRYVDEDLKDDSTAEFKDLTILSKKIVEICEALIKRKIAGRVHSDSEIQIIEDNAKKEAREILNSVILRFDAFYQNRPDIPLCPPLYSSVICNQKASSKGELRIVRMSKISGSYKGGEQIILLCDKVQKDKIQILFYETDDNEDKIWTGYGSFSQADVHYQVAITFKTPPFRTNAEKNVFVCLERNGEFSEPREFTYIAEDNPSKKRKKSIPEATLKLLSFPMEDSSSPSNSAMSVSSFTETADSQDGHLGLLESDFEEYFTQVNNNLELSDSFLNHLSGKNENCDILKDIEMNSGNENLPSPFSFNNSIIHLSDGCVEDIDFGKISVDGGKIDADGCIGQMEIGDEKHNRIWEPQAGSNERTTIRKLEGQMNDLSLTHSKCIETSMPIFNIGQMEELSKYSHLILKRDNSGNTLLHFAVQKNQNIISVMHLSRIANSDIVNVQNDKKETALHIATEKNYPLQVKLLLQYGGNPNIKNAEGNNCCHIACLNNSNDCLRILLTSKRCYSELNAFNYEGLTPLHLAIMKNSSDCIHLLWRYMDDTSVLEKKSDRSLLHLAIEFQPSLVKWLLLQGATDVNIQDCEGNTPLHIACALGNYNIVKQLLLAGANPLLKNFKRSSLNLEEENSDDQLDDEETNINNAENAEESSDDESVDGQTPADLTTDSEILKLLRQVTEKDESKLDQSQEISAETYDAATEKLCDFIDLDMRWKTVAIYFIDDSVSNSLKYSTSPTRALLKYLKKTIGVSYIQKFKEVVKMSGLNYNADNIEESNKPLIVF